MRNSSINLLNILAAILMAGALQSCDDDYFNGDNATKVTITATTAFSNTTSRAVFEGDKTSFGADDIDITNYCFLLFDDEKKRIKSLDIAPTAFPYIVELPQPVVGKTYHAFLLGNVTTETLSAVTTIDELQKSTFEINRMYNTPTDKKLFTWSDYLSVTQARKNLDFILNPNVAKITAKIKNNSSESVIKSVRVKNVVNKVGYAQNALNEYSPDYVKNVSEPTFIKYDIETFDTPLKKGDEPKTISWYVPQNIQGEGTRKATDDALANETNLDGEDDLDGLLPHNATYVEIDGVRTADNVTASYRVYPGIKKDGEKGYADMTNFDVKADVIYNLDITINNDGIDNESTNITTEYKPNSGTTATAKIKLPENSNCYMIHPIGDRIADVTVYELPISRVNQYWATVAGEPGTEADDHALTADSKWHVEVIWQDINTRAIKFCDEYGVDLPDVAPGEGLNPFCFKLVNNSNTPGSQTYGNVLVGLKKDGVEGYCWSWHLWITDYNPDAAPTWSESSNKLYATNANSGRKIDLQGCCYGNGAEDFTDSQGVQITYGARSFDGNVQHYHSAYSALWNNSNSPGVWDSGIYKNKWIMDRNLGAQSSNCGDIEHPLDGWGLYYQFGRKDPFSYKYIYDIDGDRIYSTKALGAQWTVDQSYSAKIEDGVKNPLKYYCSKANTTTEGFEWASDATNNDWYSPADDPVNPNHEIGAKTLFDPCPPGWCVPKYDAFHFGLEDEVKVLETGSLSTDYDDGVSKTGTASHDIVSKFIGDLSDYTKPHTPVTTYIDVNGIYDGRTDPDNRAKADYCENYDATTGKGLRKYGERARFHSVLHSSRGSDALKSVFPMQGNINGETGDLNKVFADNYSPVRNIPKDVSEKKIWNDYNCYTQQACLWTTQKAADNLGVSGKSGAYLIHFFTTTYTNTVNARENRRLGRYFLRFHGMMDLNYYLASRGHNVRCIQEPD